MGNLQRKLRQGQEQFNRRVRRFVLLCGVAAVCVASVLIYFYTHSPEETDRPRRGAGPRAQIDLEAPMVVPTGDPDDPSLLVMPDLLFDVVDATPLRVTPHGLRTVVDTEILAMFLEAVGKVSQKELETRADRTITWDDFVDKNRRAEIRGRICEFRGKLFQLSECSDEDVDLAELGVERLWEGQIRDRYDQWFCFYCIEKPETEPGRRDVAVLTGPFYMLLEDTSRNGEAVVAPLIVCRTVKAYPEPSMPQSITYGLLDKVPPWLFYLIFAGVCAAIFTVLTILMRPKPVSMKLRRRPMVQSDPGEPTQNAEGRDGVEAPQDEGAGSPDDESTGDAAKPGEEKDDARPEQQG